MPLIIQNALKLSDTGVNMLVLCWISGIDGISQRVTLRRKTSTNELLPCVWDKGVAKS